MPEMPNYHICHFWQRCLVSWVGFTSGTVSDSHGCVHFTVTGLCRNTSYRMSGLYA